MGPAVAAQDVQHLIAVHLRHHDVEQDEIEIPFRQPLQRIAAIDRLLDVDNPQPPQPAHQDVAILLDVVDHEGPGPGHIDRRLS